MVALLAMGILDAPVSRASAILTSINHVLQQSITTPDVQVDHAVFAIWHKTSSWMVAVTDSAGTRQVRMVACQVIYLLCAYSYLPIVAYRALPAMTMCVCVTRCLAVFERHIGGLVQRPDWPQAQRAHNAAGC